MLHSTAPLRREPVVQCIAVAFRSYSSTSLRCVGHCRPLLLDCLRSLGPYPNSTLLELFIAAEALLRPTVESRSDPYSVYHTVCLFSLVRRFYYARQMHIRERLSVTCFVFRPSA